MSSTVLLNCTDRNQCFAFADTGTTDLIVPTTVADAVSASNDNINYYTPLINVLI